jgi:hypothetical protein
LTNKLSIASDFSLWLNLDLDERVIIFLFLGIFGGPEKGRFGFVGGVA